MLFPTHVPTTSPSAFCFPLSAKPHEKVILTCYFRFSTHTHFSICSNLVSAPIFQLKLLLLMYPVMCLSSSPTDTFQLCLTAQKHLADHVLPKAVPSFGLSDNRVFWCLLISQVAFFPTSSPGFTFKSVDVP